MMKIKKLIDFRLFYDIFARIPLFWNLKFLSKVFEDGMTLNKGKIVVCVNNSRNFLHGINLFVLWRTLLHHHILTSFAKILI